MRMLVFVAALTCVVSACSKTDGSPGTLMAGAASRSVLPTVSDGRDYLAEAPGWPAREEVDPDDPGVFIEA